MFTLEVREDKDTVKDYPISESEIDFDYKCWKCGFEFSQLTNRYSIVNCPECQIICAVGKD
jgi:Zn finger protein HypA/HybF involved in hydrogenase expression